MGFRVEWIMVKERSTLSIVAVFGELFGDPSLQKKTQGPHCNSVPNRPNVRCLWP